MATSMGNVSLEPGSSRTCVRAQSKSGILGGGSVDSDHAFDASTRPHAGEGKEGLTRSKERGWFEAGAGLVLPVARAGRNRLLVFRDRLFARHLESRGLEIGKDAFVPFGSELSDRTSIGDHTRVGQLLVKSEGEVAIGSFCAIGSDVLIVASNHRMDHANLQFRIQGRLGFQNLVKPPGPVLVGHNVWIGDRATFVYGPRGLTIGNGAVIGACSVVRRDVPPFAVVLGNPAKILRYRFRSEVRDKLNEIAWWEWPLEKIGRNRSFVEADLTDLNVEDIDKLVVP
jgi:virginiamycin A acetyltransferase